MGRGKSRVAIIGSGHAAYGSCVILAEAQDIELHVFDVGRTSANSDAKKSPIPNAKSLDGSFHPYGLCDDDRPFNLISKRICSSHAYGGFGTVFSGAILKPSDQDLTDWPLESIPQTEDYYNVSREFNWISRMERPSNRGEKYPFEDNGYRSLLSENGSDAIFGWSELALNRDDSRRIVPFNPSVYFDRVRRQRKIEYNGSTFIHEIVAREDGIALRAYRDGKFEWRVGYKAIFLGAGCVNSTAILHRSTENGHVGEYKIKGTGVFMEGFVGAGPRECEELNFRRENSLPETFLEIRGEAFKGMWSHTQVSTINRHIIEVISGTLPEPVTRQVKRLSSRLHFSITSVPSVLAPESIMICRGFQSNYCPKENNDSVIIVEKNQEIKRRWRKEVVDAIGRQNSFFRMSHIPLSGLLGNIFRGNNLGGWHLGGTVPMKLTASEGLTCKPNGELRNINNVFLVDSTAFPSVPGTTVALLIMAHSSRVARKWLEKYRED